MKQKTEALTVHINNLRSLATEWSQTIIDNSAPPLDWAIAIIGGSLAKGTADFFSDIDIMLICPDGQMESLFCYITTNSGVIFNSRNRFGVHLSFKMCENLMADVHLTDNNTCRTLIQSFEAGSDTSTALQDHLWNINHGILCYSAGLYPSYKVTFNSDLRKILLNKYLTFLSTYKLEVYYTRGDYVQQWEALSTISKIILNIGYVLNSELFWGYKNINTRIDKLPIEIQRTLHIMHSIADNNWQSKIQQLEFSLDEIKAKVLSQISSINE